jgi:hypothetical protein
VEGVVKVEEVVLEVVEVEAAGNNVVVMDRHLHIRNIEILK